VEAGARKRRGDASCARADFKDWTLPEQIEIEVDVVAIRVVFAVIQRGDVLVRIHPGRLPNV